VTNAIEYCNDKVAADGSPGYYAVLFQPSQARSALVALRALERELSEVVELCSDAHVAQHKLQFWQQQLNTSETSSPHPVTRALNQFAPQALGSHERNRLLSAVQDRISRAQIQSEEELDQMCAETAGIIAAACSTVSGDDPRGAVEVAIAAERHRLLSMPSRVGLPTHANVALTTLSACAVTPQQVDRPQSEGDSDPALRQLRGALLTRALSVTQLAAEKLGSRRGYTATCLRLTRCSLNASRHADYANTGRLKHVVPLKLLWHAWRTRP
jgi:hypothetical protein